MKKIFAILLCLSLPGQGARAGVLGDWMEAMERTAEDPTSYDVYFPFAVRHARWNYTRETIDRYNEHPGGIGFGASRIDGRAEHSLYFVGFNDSNYHFQGSFGYGWLHRMLPAGSFLNLGGGFTISAQMRHEYSHIPIPLPLPFAGVDIGPVAIQAAYLPGWHGMGNVAIFWLKLRI